MVVDPSQRAAGASAWSVSDLAEARLLEFWSNDPPWERCLWTIGTVGHIQEILEALGVGLKQGAAEALKKEVLKFVGPDVGVGDPATRKALQTTLQMDLTHRSVGWLRLDSLQGSIREGYLKRWASDVRDGNPGAEASSRYLAAYLLDLGYSNQYLYRWLEYHTKHEDPRVDLADLLDAANDELAGKSPRTFSVLVPVESAPRLPDPPPATWREAPDVSALITSWGGDVANLRQNGGFQVEVRAMDRFAAIESARDTISRWNARIELATRTSLTTASRVWISGESSAYGFSIRRRGVEVRALERESQLYSEVVQDDWSARIDDAFQLAQPSESGPRSAAIAGAWATIESLLTQSHEDDRLGAPRMASIVACSFPRAELTRLARIHEVRGQDALAGKLSGRSNLERSEMVAHAILNAHPLATRGLGDEAAVERMRQLLSDPVNVLARVEDHLCASFDRLYRQRNLLLHAGLLSGDGRTKTLRSAPKLLGAGLDRIAHAWFTERTNPLELAARAELALARVGTVVLPTRLLEP